MRLQRRFNDLNAFSAVPRVTAALKQRKTVLSVSTRNEGNGLGTGYFWNHL